MGNENNTVMLYSSQSKVVVNTLKNDGVCFSKKEYVVKKYEESAPIFVAAYSWFVKEAQKYLALPQGAQYPYFAFKDLYSIDKSTENSILKLCVPKDQAIFFDMYDFNKILCLQYIGETKDDEVRFRQMLADYGVRKECDVMLTNFYPDLKRQVQDSWCRLFRHHENIKAGNITDIKSIQAGLWQLKKEWVVND